MTDHFRPVEVGDQPQYELAQQAAPQLLWVDIASLVMDDRYQRPLEPANYAAIRRIAQDFRWSRFSPIVVAPVEGGRYALIDGQHRAHAAAMCGIASIPAMVALVAPEEQALAFIDINTRQIAVSQHQIYRAALTAGEPWAIACRDAVASAGCQLMTAKWSHKDKRPGMVFSISLVRQLVAAGKGDAVTAGLRALMDYDPTATANFSDLLLRPWLMAAAETSATTDDLLTTLRAKRPWLVIETADRAAKETGQPVAHMRKVAFVAAIKDTMAKARKESTR